MSQTPESSQVKSNANLPGNESVSLRTYAAMNSSIKCDDNFVEKYLGNYRAQERGDQLDKFLESRYEESKKISVEKEIYKVIAAILNKFSCYWNKHILLRSDGGA
jgi:adenosine deaminase